MWCVFSDKHSNDAVDHRRVFDDYAGWYSGTHNSNINCNARPGLDDHFNSSDNADVR